MLHKYNTHHHHHAGKTQTPEIHDKESDNGDGNIDIQDHPSDKTNVHVNSNHDDDLNDAACLRFKRGLRFGGPVPGCTEHTQPIVFNAGRMQSVRS